MDVPYNWSDFGLDLQDTATYRNRSMVEVNTADTYDEDLMPIDGGLVDLKMWMPRKLHTPDDWLENSRNYVGHIELHKPIIRVECVNDIFRILKIHFLDDNRQVSLDRPTTFSIGDEELSTHQIEEILENLPEMLIEGDNAGLSHNVISSPSNMLLHILPVPSMTVRPSIGLKLDEETGDVVDTYTYDPLKDNFKKLFGDVDSSNIVCSEDDLTHKLVDVLRINQRLLENITINAPQQIIDDLGELLQYHVTTYIDNSTLGIPPARYRSGRPLKNVAHRIRHEPDISDDVEKYIDNIDDLFLEYTNRSNDEPVDNELLEEFDWFLRDWDKYRKRWLQSLAVKLEDEGGHRLADHPPVTTQIKMKKEYKSNITDGDAKYIDKDKKSKKDSVEPTLVIDGEVVVNEVEEVRFDQIKGLDPLITWLQRQGQTFSPEAYECFGEYPSKGVLLTGVPGCGKSMIGKAIAHEWGLGYHRVMPDQMVGRLVGDNEKAMRKLLDELKDKAPIVCFIDEAEKFLGQVRRTASYGSADAGRDSSEGMFLQFMQDDNSGVFFVFTANDFDKLSPALIDRFNERWFVDLPNGEARKDIIISNFTDKEIEGFDIDELTKLSRRYSGRDIKSTISEAKVNAFVDDNREVNAQDIIEVFKNKTPTSSIHSSKIKALRDLCSEGKFRLANTISKKPGDGAGDGNHIPGYE
jgi:SpoVK/Ycf46/Vps4 family AAA+-type ATPase